MTIDILCAKICEHFYFTLLLYIPSSYIIYSFSVFRHYFFTTYITIYWTTWCSAPKYCLCKFELQNSISSFFESHRKRVLSYIRVWIIHRVIYYIRTRAHTGLYAPRYASRRQFSKLTKQLSHSVCSCRMTRLSSCGPVAFVHEASLVRPLVLII